LDVQDVELCDQIDTKELIDIIRDKLKQILVKNEFPDPHSIRRVSRLDVICTLKNREKSHNRDAGF
jgi:hypothetical protein